MSVWVLFKDPFYRVYLFFKQIPIYLAWPSFFVLDICLFLFRLVYFTPRFFLKEKESLTFGELTYVGLSTFMELFPSFKGCSFLDLGSGHGKSCLYLSKRYGAHSIGIEIHPLFVNLSRFFAYCMGVSSRTQFICGDFFLHPFPKAALIVFPSTCFSMADLKRISVKLSKECPGSTVLSLSEPLPLFESRFKVPLLCSWGEDILYVQQVPF